MQNIYDSSIRGNLRERLGKKILRQGIFTKLQFSRVANIVQAFWNRFSEIQTICRSCNCVLDWRTSTAIHLLLRQNGRFRAHFVVNLKQIDVNSLSLIFALFAHFSSFLPLLGQNVPSSSKIMRSEGQKDFLWGIIWKSLTVLFSLKMNKTFAQHPLHWITLRTFLYSWIIEAKFLLRKYKCSLIKTLQLWFYHIQPGIDSLKFGDQMQNRLRGLSE